MGRGAKKKGSAWELEASRLLTAFSGVWKKIPGSGALSHIYKDSSLSSDLVGVYPWWRKKFRGEAKTGYGGATQITVKREWITKNMEEAREAGGYPCLILKMRNVRGKEEDRTSAKLIVFTVDTWLDLMEEIEELYDDNVKLLERIYNED